MRIAHILRKLNPTEWGGTETAIQRLVTGLRSQQVDSVIYCPRLADKSPNEPFLGAGSIIRRFKACVPIWGIPPEQKRQMISVGGNLMSFDLFPALFYEPDLAVMHTHALGRLGSIALAVARLRKLPYVITIHGGLLDLPEKLKKSLNSSSHGGWEWGKIFGLLLQSRQMFTFADAIITCNASESRLLQQQFPSKHIIVQPHGVPVENYQRDCREAARQAFPQICNRTVLLSVGRIDPVKNQLWLIEQASEIFRQHPSALLVLAGPVTDEAYAANMWQRIKELGLKDRVLFTGGLPQEDPRLLGLLQESRLLLLPSISETFGLVILEAWAAGTAVISTRTSGASALIQHGNNGWLFNLDTPASFHAAVSEGLLDPKVARQRAEAGRESVLANYDAVNLAKRLKQLYEQLIEEKHALRHPARRRHECPDTARMS